MSSGRAKESGRMEGSLGRKRGLELRQGSSVPRHVSTADGVFLIKLSSLLLSVERQLDIAAVLLQLGTSTVDRLHLPSHDLLTFGEP
jgi:hypothetical protein